MPDSMDSDGLPLWPAAERNKQPILEQLKKLLPPSGGLLLEIASGSGQHALHFAKALPNWMIQPSDCDPEHLETLRARQVLAQLDNLRPPLQLDVTRRPWPLSRADVIYNANMVHIAPWRAAEGLISGAAQLLPQGGQLITYGPYMFDGAHTSESNERFDASLRQRESSWGVRDVADLQRLAGPAGLALADKLAMPANNYLLVWLKD